MCGSGSGSGSGSSRSVESDTAHIQANVQREEVAGENVWERRARARVMGMG